jgi:hypothetical protein
VSSGLRQSLADDMFPAAKRVPPYTSKHQFNFCFCILHETMKLDCCHLRPPVHPFLATGLEDPISTAKGDVKVEDLKCRWLLPSLCCVIMRDTAAKTLQPLDTSKPPKDLTCSEFPSR